MNILRNYFSIWLNISIIPSTSQIVATTKLSIFIGFFFIISSTLLSNQSILNFIFGLLLISIFALHLKYSARSFFHLDDKIFHIPDCLIKIFHQQRQYFCILFISCIIPPLKLIIIITH